MSDIDSQIQARVEGFVSELSQLVRQAALEAVASAFKLDHTSSRRAPLLAHAPRAAVVVAAPKAAAKARPRPGRPAAAASKRRSGEKRSPEELVRITDRVGEHIKSNPGHGIEQIAKAMSTSTKELTLPVRKLLNDKKVFSKGQKRATRYFPR